jgi:hypothetical protein
VKGDESGFLDRYLSGPIFAASRDKVIPKQKATMSAQKVMLTIFFSGVSLFTMDVL